MSYAEYVFSGVRYGKTECDTFVPGGEIADGLSVIVKVTPGFTQVVKRFSDILRAICSDLRHCTSAGRRVPATRSMLDMVIGLVMIQRRQVTNEVQKRLSVATSGGSVGRGIPVSVT
ncbi:hypothetical protein Bbelb_204430 [Branchiostoma belcheri]|nr:hypothetical protein Bbelb_204430 [Branchiostoma belcheri]